VVAEESAAVSEGFAGLAGCGVIESLMMFGTFYITANG
jgi:hypothetical protein